MEIFKRLCYNVLDVLKMSLWHFAGIPFSEI